MNKYITLFGTVLITFVFAYTIPMTLRNQTTSNMLISGGLLILIILGLYTFAKSGSKKNETKQEQQEWVPAN